MVLKNCLETLVDKYLDHRRSRTQQTIANIHLIYEKVGHLVNAPNLIHTHGYAQALTSIPFLKDFEQPVENGGPAKNWLVEAFITRRLKWWKDKE